MKRTTDLVDDFVERLVEGDIESHVQEYIKSRSVFEGIYGDVDDIMAHFHEDIEKYIKAKGDSEKQSLADLVLNQILDLRLKAILLNNPNSIKAVIAERDFYKSRTDVAEERLKDVEANLRSAYSAVEKLMGDIEKMKLKGFEKKE